MILLCKEVSESWMEVYVTISTHHILDKAVLAIQRTKIQGGRETEGGGEGIELRELYFEMACIDCQEVLLFRSVEIRSSDYPEEMPKPCNVRQHTQMIYCCIIGCLFEDWLIGNAFFAVNSKLDLSKVGAALVLPHCMKNGYFERDSMPRQMSVWRWISEGRECSKVLCIIVYIEGEWNTEWDNSSVCRWHVRLRIVEFLKHLPTLCTRAWISAYLTLGLLTNVKQDRWETKCLGMCVSG